MDGEDQQKEQYTGWGWLGHSKVVDGGLPQFLRRLCWKDQEHKLHPIHVLVNFAGYYICNYYPDLFAVWIGNMMQYDAISSEIGNIGWKMNEHDAYLKHFEAPSRFGGFWGTFLDPGGPHRWHQCGGISCGRSWADQGHQTGEVAGEMMGPLGPHKFPYSESTKMTT